MTLCIAAACVYKNRDAVVLGSDFTIEGVSKADILDKLYWIHGKQWPVLISDEISRAIELKEVYRQALESAERVDRDDLLRVMYEPLRTQKRRIADEYVSRQLGMSYFHFLKHGRDELPETTREKILAKVTRLRLHADLIIVVFLPRKTPTGRVRKYKSPWIFRVGNQGVDWCEQYGCIGSGADVAESILSYREQDEETPAYRSMYHVHEAMALGAKVSPGVGEGALAIVYDNGDKIVSEQPTGKYRAMLDRVFKKRIGPRQVKKLPKLRSHDLKEF